jgi:hypothetical protein
MTFEQAMRMARRDAKVTRPSWGILRAVTLGGDGKSLDDMILDNTDGFRSGDGRPYAPTAEDRAATDWMLYQTPDENRVELDFFEE